MDTHTMEFHKLTVIKRDGSEVPVRLQEIQDRITQLCRDDLTELDPGAIAIQVVSGLRDRMLTSELDEFAAQVCSSHSSKNEQYSTLATRLVTSNLHKVIPASFMAQMSKLYQHTDSHGRHYPLISQEIWQLLNQDGYGQELDAVLQHDMDERFNYFGLKTMMKAYLMKIAGGLVERPQHMYLRVALQIHKRDLPRVKESYTLMSQHKMIHATPTLFNACTPCGNMISCFLLGTNDSMTGLYDTVKDCALISKASGGIGIHATNVRPRGSPIYGTGGTSDGIAPWLRVLDATCKHANQGGGKRNGSFVVYLEPYHGDIREFLTLRLNTGDEEMKARNLFYGLWIPNLFMERLMTDSEWSLFDTTFHPELRDLVGTAFAKKYEQLEREGKAMSNVRAMDLAEAAWKLQQQQGLPYMLFKDWVNLKSNLRHYKTTYSSNLCCEITEPSDAEEYGVCTLASINVSAFVKQTRRWNQDWSMEDIEQLYDFEELAHVAAVCCRNLDNIIDSNKYPVPQAERGSMLHRYIGIGGQGLQDLFFKLGVPFWSEKARLLNRYIAETVYYGAMNESIQLAKERGVYPTYPGSPLSEGKFQYHLWQECHPDYLVQNPDAFPLEPLYKRWDWEQLRQDVLQHGARNALLIAYMPTQSTSRINGNVAGMEPIHANMYKNSTILGTFPVINNYLVDDLKQLGLWNEDMRQTILKHDGSIQYIANIPDGMKEVYKTCFEVKQSGLLKLAADRGPFCCQSQSTNLFFNKVSPKLQFSCLALAWRLGLKTASYYIHSKPGTEADKLSLSLAPSAPKACSLLNKDCESCSA